MAKIRSFREAGERYPSLRLISILINGVGILLLAFSACAVLGGIGAILVDVVRPTIGWLSLGIALLWGLGLLVAGLQCIATATFFRLAIHIEENTRATAQALDRLRLEAEPKPEVDPRSIFLS